MRKLVGLFRDLADEEDLDRIPRSRHERRPHLQLAIARMQKCRPWHCSKVAELKGRIEAEARQSVPPLILAESMATLKPVLFGSVRFPDEAATVESQP